jgi:hypothetical protein
MNSGPREEGIGVECSGIMEPVGQSDGKSAPSIVPGGSMSACISTTTTQGNPWIQELRGRNRW